MRRDSIFRIASLTKPILATATTTLVEEGKLALDEPVDRLLPELANRAVLRAIDAPLNNTLPADAVRALAPHCHAKAVTEVNRLTDVRDTSATLAAYLVFTFAVFGCDSTANPA